MNSSQRVTVDPTGNGATDAHSDIALTSLFNACIAVVNSERQTVWQRYSAMLIANSVVFGFLADRATEDSRLLRLSGCLMGTIFAALWWLLTLDGWKFFDIYSRIAASFSWPAIDAEVNPIRAAYTEIDTIGRDRIKVAALGVIFVFIVGYIGLGVWALTS